MPDSGLKVTAPPAPENAIIMYANVESPVSIDNVDDPADARALITRMTVTRADDSEDVFIIKADLTYDAGEAIREADLYNFTFNVGVKATSIEEIAQRAERVAAAYDAFSREIREDNDREGTTRAANFAKDAREVYKKLSSTFTAVARAAEALQGQELTLEIGSQLRAVFLENLPFRDASEQDVNTALEELEFTPSTMFGKPPEGSAEPRGYEAKIPSDAYSLIVPNEALNEVVGERRMYEGPVVGHLTGDEPRDLRHQIIADSSEGTLVVYMPAETFKRLQEADLVSLSEEAAAGESQGPWTGANPKGTRLDRTRDPQD